jgi:hypothetical protein
MSRLPPGVRRAVLERARGLCEYCLSQSSITGHDFTVDHIVPGSRGGTDNLDNLCCCCSECNIYKQARMEALDPRTSRPSSLYNPRTASWDDHFRWSPTGSRIIGRTAAGRATVGLLQLNRAVLVNARQLWVQYGLHPPQRRPL